MEEAIKKAKEHGIGVVCVKGANHFGALAYYAQMAQKAGMIGTALGTGDSTMAPWGGCEKVIGNNPVSVAAPARNEVSPVLDMAMTVVANGKVSNMKRQGATEIPEGWGLDRDGLPTTSMKDTLDASKYKSKEQIESLVMLERQRELMFEGKRWYDLVRVSLRDGSTQRLVSKATVKYKDNVNRIKIKLSDPNIIFFPYNRDELKLNPYLKQNSAYGNTEEFEGI